MDVMRGFPPAPEARPSLENWDRHPFTSWSFRNMRRLFPTANVSRGTGPVLKYIHVGHFGSGMLRPG